MYSKSMAFFIASLSVLVLGTVFFMHAYCFDYALLKYSFFTRVLPASFLLGLFGYLIGKILDYAKVKK